MDDPLKKYVQENREAFDRLEPSHAVLARLRSQLKPGPTAKKGIFKNNTQRAWLAAASVLLALTITYTLYRAGKTPNPQTNQVAQQVAPPMAKDTEPLAEPTVEKQETMPSVVKNTRPQKPKRSTPSEPEALASLPPTLFAQLTDSNSASARLAAILEIERSGQMDSGVVALLAHSMNHDSNSNVRMAALDLLGKHAHDPHITELFIASLGAQDNPFVQLGLIHFLKQVDNQQVDETLYALADNPNTFIAVKDEAYAALLYQNKL